jgi:ABC-2 type transport system permease protein
VIGTIAFVTYRALVSRRRAILMLLLVLVPVGLAMLARFRGLPGDPVDRAAAIIELLVVRTVLPLVALVFGTSAIGAELDDGTAIHLLTKPVARWQIIAGKILAAGPATAVLVGASTLLTGLIVGGERGALGVTLALTLAVIVGSLLYVTVFVALSVMTSRALIIGLIYVVLWEGVLAGLFEGTQVLSIREYTMAIAAALDPSRVLTESAPLGITTAVVGSVLVLAVGFGLAARRLADLELTAGGD